MLPVTPVTTPAGWARVEHWAAAAGAFAVVGALLSLQHQRLMDVVHGPRVPAGREPRLEPAVRGPHGSTRRNHPEANRHTMMLGIRGEEGEEGEGGEGETRWPRVGVDDLQAPGYLPRWFRHSRSGWPGPVAPGDWRNVRV